MTKMGFQIADVVCVQNFHTPRDMLGFEHRLEYVLFSQGQLERAKMVTDTSLVEISKERDTLLSKYNTIRQESKR